MTWRIDDGKPRGKIGMRVGVILPMGDDAPGQGVPRRYAEIKAYALAAEAAGLDTVWVFDHLLADTIEAAEDSPWEAWSVLSGLAEATERVRLGTLVMCTSFRHAGLLARMADTVQEMSGDRLVLGIGAGWHQPEYTAFGLPFDARVDGFAEAAAVLTGMLRDGRATVDGSQHSVIDAPVRERPDRVAPEILIAAAKPRMLRLTALYADSWNLAWFGLPGPRFREASRALDAACESVGRDPASLARTAGIQLGAGSSEQGDELRLVRGDANRLADALAAWQAEGVAEVVVLASPSNAATLDLVAEATRRFRG